MVNDTRPITTICADLKRLLEALLVAPDSVFRLAEEVADHPVGVRAVPLLIRLLERNPELDWGVPGPVVHAVERYFRRGYESILLESVQREPTTHTVWMLNRLINGVSSNEREQYLLVMQEIAARNDVPEKVRQSARLFLDA